MKSLLNHSFVKTALLRVSLGLLIGNLTIAQAGGNRLSIGLVGAGPVGHRAASTDGYLLVYSATDESSDGDLPFYPHSSYMLYSSNGKFLRTIENHMSRSDELPELVKLAPGFYTVQAQSAKNGYVRVPVVVKPGRRTILDLDSRS
jgi:hypothetical protein